MKVAIGSDHGGLDLKVCLVDVLKKAGVDVTDVGVSQPGSVDYPDIALKVTDLVCAGTVDFGVLLCGTGIGMSIAANKVPGIRAALAWDIFTARMSRWHNDANVLTIGARVTGPELAREILMTFLEEPFDGGRHQRRVDKIGEIEKRGVGKG
ncbi:MAG: ribose 5-phosphate isomerase B [Deltaproteobacteria bacterium]|nr:ribose 5-phosphate isomerase B [Candidatus Zymogenaceae bacterium]